MKKIIFLISSQIKAYEYMQFIKYYLKLLMVFAAYYLTNIYLHFISQILIVKSTLQVAIVRYLLFATNDDTKCA